MTDLEKVLRRIEYILDDNKKEDGFFLPVLETVEVLEDAISLLKAKESEKVEIKDSDGGTTHWYVCGACKAPINIGDKFCHECGKKVGWK